MAKRAPDKQRKGTARTRSVAPDPILEREDPGTSSPEDARHWIAVYNQLIEFKARLLSRAQRDMKSLPPEARKAVEADFILIEAQRSRYQRQRDFWYTRQWELEGVSIDSETRSVDHRGKSASFTNREFQLLQLFLAHPGRFFKAPELLLQAWHDPGLSEEELRTYMGQLDKKLAGLRLGRVAHRGRQGYSIEFTSLE